MRASSTSAIESSAPPCASAASIFSARPRIVRAETPSNGPPSVVIATTGLDGRFFFGTVAARERLAAPARALHVGAYERLLLGLGLVRLSRSGRERLFVLRHRLAERLGVPQELAGLALAFVF